MSLLLPNFWMALTLACPLILNQMSLTFAEHSNNVCLSDGLRICWLLNISSPATLMHAFIDITDLMSCCMVDVWWWWWRWWWLMYDESRFNQSADRCECCKHTISLCVSLYLSMSLSLCVSVYLSVSLSSVFYCLSVIVSLVCWLMWLMQRVLPEWYH